MKRSEATELITAVINIRNNADDETAAKCGYLLLTTMFGNQAFTDGKKALDKSKKALSKDRAFCFI